MRTRLTVATTMLAGICALGGSVAAQTPKAKSGSVALSAKDPFSSPPPAVFGTRKPSQSDSSVRRVQAPGMDSPALPVLAPATVEPGPVRLGAQSISLQAALYGAITNNPDLVSLRNSNIASPEAVEVARRFPTALNPTLWIDYRPLSLIPPNPFPNGSGSGTGGTPHTRTGPYYSHGSGYLYISLRQPFELGKQTSHRHAIARAALSQQQWTVMQAELLATVQTYRFYETAAYRREKLRVAKQLAQFNDRLVADLRKRLDANQAAPADVVLAEVESQATRQLVEVAEQDYAIALADLRNQVGLPESAGSAEPLGEFLLPKTIPAVDEATLVQMALCSRPDIFAARAQASGALAAVNLARGDRIPTPIIGPEYQTDEAQIQYFGLVFITPIPYVNNGKPLVRQREADYRRSLMNVQQVEKRAVIQVKAAAAKWNASSRLVSQTSGLSTSLRTEVDRMERLFDANQADLTRLLQVRQRLIQLENAELDALWQATQAQADLLTALGAPHLIAALNALETTTPVNSAVPVTLTAPAPAQTASAAKPATVVR